MKMDYNKINELLFRLIDNEINDSELNELTDWLNSSREAQVYYCQFMRDISGISLKKMTAIPEDHSDANNIAELTIDSNTSVRGIDINDVLSDKDQEEAYDILYDAANTSALLQGLADDVKTAPSVDVEKPIAKPIEEFIPKPSKTKRKVSKFSVFTLAFSAAAMILLLITLHLAPSSSKVVAVLSDQVGTEWKTVSSPLETGSVLLSDEYSLSKGFVKIRLNKGTEVVIEGPAEFELLSNNKMTLSKGKLSAVVPGSAKGFTVVTPSSTVVDIGTEFGVKLDSQGNSEVHMFEGSASLVPVYNGQKGKVHNLIAGQAARVKLGDTVSHSIDISSKGFTRYLPSAYELAVKESKPFFYWNFADGNKSKIKNYIDEKFFSGNIHGPVKYVQGPDLGVTDNKAMYLDGRESYVVVDQFNELRKKANAYSIAFWARFDQLKEQCILATTKSVSNTKRNRCVITTSDNRLTHSRSDIVKATSVSDVQYEINKWYHIVITAKSYGQKRLHINGKLSGVFSDMADVGGLLPQLIIGRTYVPLDGEVSDSYYPFKGAVDELAIYDRQLSQDEVAKIYRASQVSPGLND